MFSLFDEEHEGAEPGILRLTAGKITAMIRMNSREFVILLNRSGGTEYYSVKDEIIDVMTCHLSESIDHERIRADYILGIITANFFQGILKIAEKYQDDPEIENDVEVLVEYRMAGIARFFKSRDSKHYSHAGRPGDFIRIFTGFSENLR